MPTQPDEALKAQLIEVLKGNDIFIEQLGVAYAGQHTIMGEFSSVEYLAGSLVKLKVKNPRRLLAIERMNGGAISVQFTLIDFHLLAGKQTQMTVFPHAYFLLVEQDEETQLRHLVLYAEYLEHKRQMSAQEAGIVLPTAAGLPGQNGRAVR